MRIRSRARWAACAVAVAVLIAALPGGVGVRAAHESTNTLVFAPVEGSAAPAAAGRGVIDYRGGVDDESRWTLQLQFSGLAPSATYVAVLQGHLGENESPEATAFTELCVVRTTASGDGGCWWYLLGMRRIGVVQLRVDAVDGPPVAQATRDAAGPGSITSAPNDFSPPAASPVPAPPAASPTAG